LFGSGIDRVGCTLDAALDLDIVERRGSWYAYEGNNLAQGRLNVVELLKTDKTLGQQLEAEVKQALMSAGKDSEKIKTVIEDVAEEEEVMEARELEAFLE
jgi:recombination protein RecA